MAKKQAKKSKKEKPDRITPAPKVVIKVAQGDVEKIERLPSLLGTIHARKQKAIADRTADITYQGDNPALAMGTLLAIPADIDLDSLTWRTPQGRRLAEAAQQDTEEARAAKRLQASANAYVGPALSHSAGSTDTSPAQMRAGLTLSQMLFDGGRSDRLIDWREQLAEAARLGQLNAQEQLALTTISLALDRSRYRIQTQIFDQSCAIGGCHD